MVTIVEKQSQGQTLYYAQQSQLVKGGSKDASGNRVAPVYQFTNQYIGNSLITDASGKQYVQNSVGKGVYVNTPLDNSPVQVVATTRSTGGGRSSTPTVSGGNTNFSSGGKVSTTTGSPINVAEGKTGIEGLNITVSTQLKNANPYTGYKLLNSPLRINNPTESFVVQGATQQVSNKSSPNFSSINGNTLYIPPPQKISTNPPSNNGLSVPQFENMTIQGVMQGYNPSAQIIPVRNPSPQESFNPSLNASQEKSYKQAWQEIPKNDWISKTSQKISDIRNQFFLGNAVMPSGVVYGKFGADILLNPNLANKQMTGWITDSSAYKTWKIVNDNVDVPIMGSQYAKLLMPTAQRVLEKPVQSAELFVISAGTTQLLSGIAKTGSLINIGGKAFYAGDVAVKTFGIATTTSYGFSMGVGLAKSYQMAGWKGVEEYGLSQTPDIFISGAGIIAGQPSQKQKTQNNEVNLKNIQELTGKKVRFYEGAKVIYKEGQAGITSGVTTPKKLTINGKTIIVSQIDIYKGSINVYGKTTGSTYSDVLAHEVGHGLTEFRISDAQMKILMPTPNEYGVLKGYFGLKDMGDISKFYSTNKNPSEFIAEGLKAYILEPKAVEALTPNFYNRAKIIIGSPQAGIYGGYGSYSEAVKGTKSLFPFEGVNGVPIDSNLIEPFYMKNNPFIANIQSPSITPFMLVSPSQPSLNVSKSPYLTGKVSKQVEQSSTVASKNTGEVLANPNTILSQQTQAFQKQLGVGNKAPTISDYYNSFESVRQVGVYAGNKLITEPLAEFSNWLASPKDWASGIDKSLVKLPNTGEGSQSLVARGGATVAVGFGAGIAGAGAFLYDVSPISVDNGFFSPSFKTPFAKTVKSAQNIVENPKANIDIFSQSIKSKPIQTGAELYANWKMFDFLQTPSKTITKAETFLPEKTFVPIEKVSVPKAYAEGGYPSIYEFVPKTGNRQQELVSYRQTYLDNPYNVFTPKAGAQAVSGYTKTITSSDLQEAPFYMQAPNNPPTKTVTNVEGYTRQNPILIYSASPAKLAPEDTFSNLVKAKKTGTSNSEPQAGYPIWGANFVSTNFFGVGKESSLPSIGFIPNWGTRPTVNAISVSDIGFIPKDALSKGVKGTTNFLSNVFQESGGKVKAFFSPALQTGRKAEAEVIIPENTLIAPKQVGSKVANIGGFKYYTEFQGQTVPFDFYKQPSKGQLNNYFQEVGQNGFEMKGTTSVKQLSEKTASSNARYFESSNKVNVGIFGSLSNQLGVSQNAPYQNTVEVPNLVYGGSPTKSGYTYAGDVTKPYSLIGKTSSSSSAKENPMLILTSTSNRKVSKSYGLISYSGDSSKVPVPPSYVPPRKSSSGGGGGSGSSGGYPSNDLISPPSSGNPSYPPSIIANPNYRRLQGYKGNILTSSIIARPSGRSYPDFNSLIRNNYQKPRKKKFAKYEAFILPDLYSVSVTEQRTGREARVPKATKQVKGLFMASLKGYSTGYVPTEEIRSGKIRFGFNNKKIRSIL